MTRYLDPTISATITDEGQRNAYTDGVEHGRNAASWLFNGNVTDLYCQKLVKGLEDCDPEVMDLMPSLLSGEWAGESMNELLGDDHNEQMADAYSDGFSDGWQDEVQHLASLYDVNEYLIIRNVGEHTTGFATLKFEVPDGVARSIDIYGPSKERAATVNWSAMGSQPAWIAAYYAGMLKAAADYAEEWTAEFNRDQG